MPVLEKRHAKLVLGGSQPISTRSFLGLRGFHLTHSKLCTFGAGAPKTARPFPGVFQGGSFPARNSGFDKGHLAPSLALSFRREKLIKAERSPWRASYYASNIAPQPPGRGKRGGREQEGGERPRSWMSWSVFFSFCFFFPIGGLLGGL